MRPISESDRSEFRGVRFVLTDMDETLTYRGRLSAQTYDALERLQAAGVTVIPVTAAPAGWCDQMARMWPVDGVIGENGGFFFRRTSGHAMERRFWHSVSDQAAVARQLVSIGKSVQAAVTGAILADDQPFRLTSLAFVRPDNPDDAALIVNALREAGAEVTVNNLWVLGWLGKYDKLAMSRRVLSEHYGINVDSERDAVLYVGDSTNDAPMFEFFHHTVGVSTVRRHLRELPKAPRWLTTGPGGSGFVEAADAVIRARSTEQ